MNESLLKDIHDKMLASKPESAVHDESTCVMCQSDSGTVSTSSAGGGDMKTYTEDEFNAALREAVAPLQAELDTLKSSQVEGEIQAKVDAAVSEFAQKLADLQSELDKAELRASEAVKERDEIVAFLEAEVKTAEEAALLEAKRSERKEAIQEVASFSDEYVDANLDRWTAMDDEAFTAVLEDWKAVVKAKVESVEGKDGAVTATVDQVVSAAAETAMSHVRSDQKSYDAKAVFGSVFGASDIRKI